MNPAAKLAGFAVVLAVSFGAAFGIGRVVGGSDGGEGRPAPGTPATSVVTTSTTMDHGAHP